MPKCIFCERADIQIKELPEIDSKRVDCPLCKSYIVSNTALADNIIDKITKEDRILFSAYIRKNALMNDPVRLLSGDIIKIPEKVSFYKKLYVLDKINIVITFIARKSKSIGENISIDYLNDFTEFFCSGPTELRTIINYLKDIGYLNVIGSIGSSTLAVALTVSGWQAFENLKETNIDNKNVFVAMSFKNPDYKNIFEKGIVPACEECGLKAIRIDLIEHNEKICDEIISEIKNSRLIITDFTDQRQNVYFEAGFALGLGIKVIWTCFDREKDNLHFDTRQYNHILWKDYEDFKAQLINRIRATVL